MFVTIISFADVFFFLACIGRNHLRDLKRRLPFTTNASASLAGSPTRKQGNATLTPPPDAIGDIPVLGNSCTVGNSHTGAADNERVGRQSDLNSSEPTVRPNALVLKRTFQQNDEQPVVETKVLQHSQRRGLGLRPNRLGQRAQKGAGGVLQLQPKDAAAGLDEIARTVNDDINTLVIHQTGGEGVDEGGSCEGSGDGLRSTKSRPSELFDSLDLSLS